MKLLLIRHGESVANAERRVQGQFDSPLNDLGKKQASALADRLQSEEWPISAIYASDLSRASETADILGQAFALPVEIDIRLREYDAGELNGILWHEIELRYPEIWHGFHHSTEWVPLPGEEGTETFHARTVAVIADIRQNHAEDDAIAIVSHGASLSMVLVHLLDMNPHRPLPFLLDNASLSIVEYTPRGPRLILLNDTCHLDKSLRVQRFGT